MLDDRPRSIELDAARIAHAQMVSEVIGRMSNHSFALKALAVAMVGGVLAMIGSMQNASRLHVILGVVPIAVLWWMDARYLMIECRYRELFADVRSGTAEPLELSATRYAEKVGGTSRYMFNWNVVMFYGIMIAALVGAAALMKGE